MDTIFKIDGLTSLKISTDPPRNVSDACKFVWIQVDRTPLPTLIGHGDEQGYGQAPTEVIASFGMRPGEARTIASALMTAAQQAR